MLYKVNYRIVLWLKVTYFIFLYKVRNFEIYDDGEIVKDASLITFFQKMLAIKVAFYPLNKVNTGYLRSFVIVCYTSLNFKTSTFVFNYYFILFLELLVKYWKMHSSHRKLMTFVLLFHLFLELLNLFSSIKFCMICMHLYDRF